MSEFWLPEEKRSVFIPSERWSNIEEFFADVKPPFYEDYKI